VLRFTLPNSLGNPAQDFRPHRDTDIPGQGNCGGQLILGLQGYQWTFGPHEEEKSMDGFQTIFKPIQQIH
jgi:hypothetical protein